MIRVLLVDDQNLVRQGVQALLDIADDIEVIGEARSGQEALEMVPKLNPDVVLLTCACRACRV